MPKHLGIAYTMEGKGKDVLLLHGWGANRECFAYISQFLSRTHRVLAVDLYGFGESDMPTKPMSVFDYASSLESLLELIDFNPDVIIAHSFGGRVAIKMVSNGFKVNKLVLMSSAGVMPRRGLKYYFKVYTYKLLKKLKLIEKLGLQGRFGSRDFRQTDSVMRETFKLIVNEDLTPALSGIDCDTLLIWGDMDRETPMYMANIMNKNIKNSGLCVIEGGGHFCFLDRPNQVNRVLDSFLTEK